MIFNLEVGQAQRQDSRQARCGGDRRLTLLQYSQSLPRSSNSWLGIARIDVTFDFASKASAAFSGGLERKVEEEEIGSACSPSGVRLMPDRIARV